MADLEIHRNDCTSLLGHHFGGIHLWLDRNHKKGDMSHREIDHNWGGILRVVEIFSEKAGIAAIVHIIRDITGLKPFIEEVQEVFETHKFPSSDWQ